jgi:hypothetical protein
MGRIPRTSKATNKGMKGNKALEEKMKDSISIGFLTGF